VRAVILVLAALVCGLSVSTLLYEPPETPSGPALHLNRFLGDARAGERAEYVDNEGNTTTFTVERLLSTGPEAPPAFRIRREIRDRTGAQVASDAYDHWPAFHFLFPLTAPQDPLGFDRTWIWQRIRREPTQWRGQSVTAWRFDAIDPALPDDEDTVVAWLNENIPVFGLLRWQRGGKTWTVTSLP
jgi:hypothetical protein